MSKQRDPLVVKIPDVLGKVEEEAKRDPEWLPLLDKRDVDLRKMNHGQLEAECARLRAGIRAHRDAKGHNLCWYVPELWNLLPEQVTPKPKVPPREEFLANCAMYRDSLKKT